MIRSATPADIPTIVQRYRQLVQEMTQLDPQMYRPLKEDDPAYFLAYLNNDLARLFVAESEEKVIGFALVVLAQTGQQPEFVRHHFALLIDLFVAQPARRQGYGQQLLDAVLLFAHQKNAEFVQLNVLAGNTAARRLYARNGYQDLTLTMQKPLAADDH